MAVLMSYRQCARKMLLGFIAAWMCVAVNGQAPCLISDVPLQQNFEISQFMGRWYEILWIAPSWQDNGLAWINYYHVYSADRYGMVTGFYSGKDPNTGQCFLGGLANLKVNDDPAKLRQYNEGQKREAKKNVSGLDDHWVLQTDYTSYAITYSCWVRSSTNNDTCDVSRSWLWSRSRTLPQRVKDDAKALFQGLCMNMTLLYDIGFVGDDCEPEGTSHGYPVYQPQNTDQTGVRFLFRAGTCRVNIRNSSGLYIGNDTGHNRSAVTESNHSLLATSFIAFAFFGISF